MARACPTTDGDCSYSISKRTARRQAALSSTWISGFLPRRSVSTAAISITSWCWKTGRISVLSAATSWIVTNRPLSTSVRKHCGSSIIYVPLSQSHSKWNWLRSFYSNKNCRNGGVSLVTWRKPVVSRQRMPRRLSLYPSYGVDTRQKDFGSPAISLKCHPVRQE